MKMKGTTPLIFARPIAVALAVALIVTTTSAAAGGLQAPSNRKQEPGAREAGSSIATPAAGPEKLSDTPVAIAGKPASASVGKKKFPWLVVVGAAIVAGGIVAILVSTKKEKPGNIFAASNPSGATIFLDGADTGKTTSATLTGVSAGTHELKLTKEGYKDFLQAVTVRSKETTTVNATLLPYAIAVSSPASGAGWIRGDPYDIIWTTDASAARLSARSLAAGLSPAGSGRFGSTETRDLGERGLVITQVNIDLYKGGTKFLAIAANSPNDSAERWTVPTGQVLGADYRIRVSCASAPEIFGESATFSIISPLWIARLKVTYTRDLMKVTNHSQIGSLPTLNWSLYDTDLSLREGDREVVDGYRQGSATMTSSADANKYELHLLRVLDNSDTVTTNEHSVFILDPSIGGDIRHPLGIPIIEGITIEYELTRRSGVSNLYFRVKSPPAGGKFQK
jgi:hypothetical protein